MQNCKTIKLSELMKKFRTNQDRINFFREHNLYMPSTSGFDSKFFIQVLQGQKKLLPLGMGCGFSFKYFTGTHKFTKQHLWNYFSGDQKLKSYIPDDVGLDSLKREFLFSVLAYERKELYLSLYNEYKEICANSAYNKYEEYGVKLDADMLSKIENFISSSGGEKKKAFRLTKNGQPINEIQKLSGRRVMEINNNNSIPSNSNPYQNQSSIIQGNPSVNQNQKNPIPSIQNPPQNQGMMFKNNPFVLQRNNSTTGNQPQQTLQKIQITKQNKEENKYGDIDMRDVTKKN